MDQLFEQLIQLVNTGDFCGRNLSLSSVLKKLRRSMDLYRQEPFSLDSAIESEAPVLVFCGACNDVAAYKACDSLLTTIDHVRKECNLSKGENVINFIEDVAAETEGDGAVWADQCTLHLNAYTTMLHFARTEAYVYPFEMWGQLGSRETPMHVDHGHSVAFIPPCMKRTFKIWVFYRDFKAARNTRTKNGCGSVNRMLADPLTNVVVQQPGDVVYVNNLIYHAVVMGYTLGTQAKDKWGLIGGNVIIKAEDAGSSCRYVNAAAIGVSKGSKAAWMRVLPAFTYMDGREWDNERYDEEKKLLLAKLQVDQIFRARSVSSHKRIERKRKLTEKLAAAREAKKK